MHFRFRTHIDKRIEEHSSRHLATVIIEPDHPRVSLVWQCMLAVRKDGDYLDETIVTEKNTSGVSAMLARSQHRDVALERP